MNFKKWLQQEMFTQSGIEFGSAIANPDIASNIQNTEETLVSWIKKVDSILGATKFIKALPPTLKAQIKFLHSVYIFTKKPNYNNLSQIIKNSIELTSLSVYSGLTVPVALAIGGEQAAVIAKAISYAYFYLGNWAEKNLKNPKYQQMAEKIQKVMPKTIKH